MCAICCVMSLRYACTSCFGRVYAVKLASTSAVTKVQLCKVPAMVTWHVEKCLEEGVMYIWSKNIVSFLDNEDTVISLRGFIWNSLCPRLCRALPTPTRAIWVLWYLPVRSGRPICVSLYSVCNRGMTYVTERASYKILWNFSQFEPQICAVQRKEEGVARSLDILPVFCAQIWLWSSVPVQLLCSNRNKQKFKEWHRAGSNPFLWLFLQV